MTASRNPYDYLSLHYVGLYQLLGVCWLLIFLEVETKSLYMVESLVTSDTTMGHAQHLYNRNRIKKSHKTLFLTRPSKQLTRCWRGFQKPKANRHGCLISLL